MFPVYLFIIPGLICFALVKKNVIPELSAEFNVKGSQGAFPMMVQYLLPAGLRGIVVAGLLSALMGSLAGVFNACSTLFTVDIYEKWRPKATQAELVRMGRLATVVMVVIALLWIPVVKGAHGLYEYLQSVQGYLAPPIFVVFFLGVFWKRLNAQGCFWAMVVGFIVGIFRMAIDTPITLGLFKSYPEGSFFWIVNNINFQYFSHPHHPRFRRGDGGGQLHDPGAEPKADPRPDLRHRHRGGQGPHPRKLEQVGRDRLARPSWPSSSAPTSTLRADPDIRDLHSATARHAMRDGPFVFLRAVSHRRNPPGAGPLMFWPCCRQIRLSGGFANASLPKILCEIVSRSTA